MQKIEEENEEENEAKEEEIKEEKPFIGPVDKPPKK